MMSTEFLSQKLKAEFEALRGVTDWKDMGPEFDEVTNDILHSDSIASLFMGIPTTFSMQGATPKTLAAMAKLMRDGDPTGRYGEVVKQHMDIFGILLALFYWGVKIGKQTAVQEATLVANAICDAVPANDKHAVLVEKLGILINDLQQTGFAAIAMDIQMSIDDSNKV
jgi:hypothetical protein